MTLRKAKFIKTKKKIKANVFDLHFDEVKWVNGNKTIRDLIVHNGITCIVPIIDKKFIVLLKQYRYGSDQIMLEVPAGTIDPGERPLSCAKRELIEETGYHGKKPCSTISLNCNFVSPGLQDDIVECDAKVTRTTKSLVFIEGNLISQDKIILSASGIWKILNQ